MSERRPIGMVLAALLTSCSFVPTYERPIAPIASQYPGGAVANGRVAADLGWRDVFADPRLQALIGQALRNNRDLRVATLNVELLRAQYRIQRAALYPSVGASAGGDLGGSTNGARGTYRVGIGAAFELDLFGRIRSLKAQALEQYLASEAAQRAAHLTLVAEVATQYLRGRALDEQRAIAERTLATVRESSELTRRLLEAGQRSALDSLTAEAQIHAARAELARITRLRAQADNALVLLVGQSLPAALPAPPQFDTELIADIPTGLPSDLLHRRPDVLAAEHSLKAANANIGAARAAFFPTISLTGFAGLATFALSGLFSGGVALATISPSITVPLFTGGANSANLDASRVRMTIEVARYERAIQVAFREVADALAARGALDEQLEAQVARATAEQQRFEISETRYRNGVESYLVVLTAQRDLYVTQNQLVDLRLARLANLVELYTALGGGWLEQTRR